MHKIISSARLSSPAISSQHCIITWNGKEDDASTVTVQDNSSNGTFINGIKIVIGRSCILRDGNEIAFGTCIPQDKNRAQDYRFIFRHIANGKDPEGLEAYYDVSNEIGQGSFGSVVKAICRRTGEWCAVKIISERMVFPRKGKAKETDDDIATNHRAIAREVAILRKLTHPNIVEFKEIFFSGVNGMQIVLEYVGGGNLHEYLENHARALGEAEAQHFTYQICLALDYVHQMGIVHRDLKPANILLTKSNPPTVKVADFGLAKAVDAQTMLRTQCGTESYVAPEVLQQNGEGYDHLVDSWSVGVIVYNMLTLTTPFDADLSRTSDRVVNWSPPKNVDLSKEANDFTRCLLQSDPYDRMSMGDALKHALLKMFKRGARKLSSNEDLNVGSSHPTKQPRKV